MAWTKSGTTITQTAGTTDTDLTGLASITGVTTFFEGEVRVYKPTDGDRIDIAGTLTIDPITNRLHCRTNRFLTVLSTGKLIVGGSTTIGGFERFHDGVAITNSLAQPVWFGSAANTNNNGMGIETGGEFEWISGIIQGPFGIAALGSVWIRNGVLKTQDYDAVSTDPQTLNTVADNVGTYVGVFGANRLLESRGFLTYFLNTDTRIDNLRSVGGGEIVFNFIGSGTNTLSGTANGVFGYSAEQTLVAIFSRSRNITGQFDGLFDFEYSNIAISGKGNIADVAVQSIGNTPTEGRFTNITITNAEGGTAVNILAAEQQGPDNRNKGAVAIYRDIDFEFAEGLDPTNALTGGRYYVIDTNNGNRQDKGGLNPSNQGFDFVQNFEYSDTFTSGALTNGLDTILIGAVQSITTGGLVTPNSDNDPTQTGATETWGMDIRGTSNVLGADLFDFHIWRYEDNYLPLLNTSLSDGTLNTLIIQARSVEDTSVTSTRTVTDALNTSIGTGFVVANSGITTTSTAVNLDQVYDLCKYKKETSEANLKIPSSSTLILDSDGTEIDLGTITTTVGTAKWTVGTNHKSIKHDTTFDASKITQSSDLTITAPIITNLPTSVLGTFVNSTASTGAGGHTLASTSTLTGDWTFTLAGNTLNGAITGDLTISGAGNLTSGVGFDMTGTLTLNGSGNWACDSGSDTEGIDLVVPSGVTINIAGKLQDSDFNSVTGSGTVNYIADLGDTIFEIPSGLPSGRVILKLRSASAGTYIADTTHTSGTTTTVATIANVSSGEGTYDMYYKPTNTFGNSGIFYLTTFLTDSNDNTSDTVNSITHVEHPDVLTSDAEKATLTGLTASLNTITTGTTGIITIAGASSSEINAPQTQAILMRVMDDENYLNLIANNQSEVDYIVPDINSALEIDESKITITSLASSGQQLISGVSGKGSGSLSENISTGGTPSSIVAVFIAANPAGLSETQAKNASGKALDERLVTANNMENLGLGTPVVKDGSLGTTFHNT